MLKEPFVIKTVIKLCGAQTSGGGASDAANLPRPSRPDMPKLLVTVID